MDTNQPVEVPTPRVNAMIQRADKIHIPEGHTFEYVRPKDASQLEHENIALLTALQNVVARLEWALKFTGALTDTGNELDGGKLFVLNYDEANWDNADEWRPVALRHLTAARAAIKSATEKA